MKPAPLKIVPDPEEPEQFGIYNPQPWSCTPPACPIAALQQCARNAFSKPARVFLQNRSDEWDRLTDEMAQLAPETFEAKLARLHADQSLSNEELCEATKKIQADISVAPMLFEKLHREQKAVETEMCPFAITAIDDCRTFVRDELFGLAPSAQSEYWRVNVDVKVHYLDYPLRRLESILSYDKWDLTRHGANTPAAHIIRGYLIDAGAITSRFPSQRGR